MDQILASKTDKSVNFIEEHLTGFLESRYVRRCQEYFICYLSSQTGCNMGCKFCHLTATGQTSFKDSDYMDFMGQAIEVFKHYRKAKEELAGYVHFDFMARGEPLSNQYIKHHGDELLMALAKLAEEEGVSPKFNISTILPKNLNMLLSDIFKLIHPTIYYSMYSVNPEFRKKWLPAALDVPVALKLLKDYQYMTKKIIKIHFAFIKGENDSPNDINNLCDTLEKKKLLYDFNMVRYNPFSPEQGEETDKISEIQEILKQRVPGKVKLIERVGFDCKASCGMFVQ